MIKVCVVYALPDKLYSYTLMVKSGTTVSSVVRQSNLLKDLPTLIVENMPIGIFGKKIIKPEEYQVENNDRIEIYRPITADAKSRRKKRALAKSK